MGARNAFPLENVNQELSSIRVSPSYTVNTIIRFILLPNGRNSLTDGNTMANTVRFLPTAFIYTDGNVLLSSETNLASGLSPHVIASTVAKVNAAITELNTYYWLYGYATSPNLPLLPTIPTTNPPANAIFYQSQVVSSFTVAPVQPGLQAGMSQLLIDGRGQTSGYTQPNAVLDALLAEPTLGNINQALTNIASGKS